MKKYLYISLTIYLFISSFGCRESIVPPEKKEEPKPHVLSLRRVTNPSVERVVWFKEHANKIEWEVTANLDFVKIKLERKDYEEYLIIDRTANDGSYEWVIPGDLPSSHHYKIKLISYENSLIYTKSVEFEIKALTTGEIHN